MRIYRRTILLAVLTFAASAVAQSEPDRVCEVNLTVPKPGASKAWEDARKQHNKFHVAEKDKNGILVWSVTTGPSTGSYLTTTCGLLWKDLDSANGFEDRDQADRVKTIAPQTASNSASYYVFLPKLSSAGAPGPDSKPAKMLTIVHYFLKAGSIPQFTDAIQRINAAIKKTEYPARPSRWYVLANGGEGPHYVLVTDRASWADMQPPQQSLMDMLKQSGDEKALQDLRDAIRYTVSEMAEYRADLSYLPAK